MNSIVIKKSTCLGMAELLIRRIELSPDNIVWLADCFSLNDVAVEFSALGKDTLPTLALCSNYEASIMSAKENPPYIDVLIRSSIGELKEMLLQGCRCNPERVVITSVDYISPKFDLLLADYAQISGWISAGRMKAAIFIHYDTSEIAVIFNESTYNTNSIIESIKAMPQKV